MRPFPGKNLSNEQRILNYRLSRARRMSENVFGIMVQKFRMFMRPLQGNPDNITRVVLAACIIHNFIRINEDYKVPEVSDNTDTTPVEKSRLQDFPRRRGGENREAFNVREFVREFSLSNSSTLKRVVWSGKNAGLS
ncbi:unnamed protein product [Arctia plantaginis]|uniref:DDE Tnp4 domain-containing protein n=1 Tax=Arctia plantaginis TaxID=874455 RepID=A0A8S0YNH7_ARCPL|nr:unnamed protein product [Arctia plantaginis]